MARMIQEFDRGFMLEAAWHKHPNYEVVSEITPAMVEHVLCFPMDYCEVISQLPDGTQLKNPSNQGVYRTDHKLVLLPCTGDGFTIPDYKEAVVSVLEMIIRECPEYRIDTVGTLLNGRGLFVNIWCGDFQLPGDFSRTVSRFQFSDMLGVSAIKIGACVTRTVCMNTLRASNAEMEKNKSLTCIKHTGSVTSRAKRAFEAIALLKVQLEETKNLFENLATRHVSKDMAEAFANEFLVRDVKDGKALSTVGRAASRIIHRQAQTMSKDLNNSAYGMFQAYVDALDHTPTRDDQDDTFRTWDGLYGNRARLKKQAVDFLLQA